MTAVGAVVVQIHEAEEGRVVEGNSLLCRDLAQCGINVRQMIRGNVVDEGAVNFVVAHAAMETAQEQNELRTDGDESGQNGVPVNRHERTLA